MKLQWIHDHDKTQLNLVTAKVTVCAAHIDHERRTATIHLSNLPGLGGLHPFVASLDTDAFKSPQQIVMENLKQAWPATTPFPDFLPDSYPPLEPETITLRTYSELDCPPRCRALIQLNDLLAELDRDPLWDESDTQFLLKTALRQFTF